MELKIYRVMGKSLGDFNIKRSSSKDSKNIQWSEKNPFDEKKKNIFSILKWLFDSWSLKYESYLYEKIGR